MFNKVYEYIKKFIKENYIFLIVFAVTLFLFYYELPYVIYKVGGTIDLEDRIEVEEDNEESGSFSMAYVSSMKGTLPLLALAKILPDWDIYPIEDITDGDYDDIVKVGKENLKDGIDNAIISAFRESEYGINITRERFKVILIDEGANTDLVRGDEILKINNKEITNRDELGDAITSLKPGTKVKIRVVNNEKEYDREAITYEKDDKIVIGIYFKVSYEYETPIPISVSTKRNETGSSGSFMTSLAIYNSITEEDITKGLNIVGTGVISFDGTASEIDGVKYKVLGAEKAGADIFFCPPENYKEAVSIKKKRKLKVKIVKVDSLKTAINYLKNYN